MISGSGNTCGNLKTASTTARTESESPGFIAEAAFSIPSYGLTRKPLLAMVREGSGCGGDAICGCWSCARDFPKKAEINAAATERTNVRRGNFMAGVLWQKDKRDCARVSISAGHILAGCLRRCSARAKIRMFFRSGDIV